MTQNNCRIVVQRNVSSVSRTYNTTATLSKSPTQSFLAPLREKSVVFLEEMGNVGRELVEEVYALDGVVNVTITPHSLEVRIGVAFKWEEDGIHERIIKALTNISMQQHEVSEDKIRIDHGLPKA